jgi:hypothetical protein
MQAFFRRHQHAILQTMGAFICIVLAMPLVAIAMLSHTVAATRQHTEPVAYTKPSKELLIGSKNPTHVPTAQLAPTQEPVSQVAMPTITPTLETALTETIALSPTTTSTDTLALAPTPTATAPALPAAPRTGPGGLPYPLHLGELNYGVVGHFYWTDRPRALGLARDAGFQWVRQQIHWRDIEDDTGAFFWGDLDNIVADVNSQGMLLMLSVVRSPVPYTSDGSDGMPDDPATLARFLEALVQRYQGRVHAIQIWNEQNLAHENGGSVTLDDAGHYVELLAAAYPAIKAVDPTIIVVSGAMAPTGINDPANAVPDIDYLRAMYRYNNGMIRDYFDVQAVHPFGSANPPETLWPDNPSTANGWNDNPTFYFRHIENLRQVMEEEGLGQHQVWITEFGWATQNNTPGYEYGNQVSFEMQRDYLVGAMQYTVDNYPWVGNMFVWNLNFTILQAEHGVDPLHEQGSFSILNADWTPRPAYFGIQQFILQQRGVADGG